MRRINWIFALPLATNAVIRAFQGEWFTLAAATPVLVVIYCQHSMLNDKNDPGNP